MKWLVAILLFGSWAEAQELQFTRYLYKIENGAITERGVFALPAPRIKDIEADRFRFNDYPQFIDYLLSEAPTLKTRHVLLHHSGSLQHASPESPRVVLFEGGVFYAFSEHPENRRLAVEMIEVDPQTFEPSFSEIVFDENGPKIERNPASCIACHGSPAKILWDSYDFWPNAFGAAVGNYRKVGEEAAYARLFANRGGSPLLSRIEMEPELRIEHEMNTAYTQFVAQLNLPRFVREKVNSVDFGGWKYPLFSMFGVCHNSGEFNMNRDPETWLQLFRPEEQDTIRSKFNEIFTDLMAARTRFKNLQDGQMEDYFPGPNDSFIDHSRLIGEVGDLAMMRTVFAFTGIDATNLSTSHVGNDNFIANPSNLAVDLATVFFDQRRDLFFDVKFDVLDLAQNRDAYIKPDCADMKTKSLTAVRNLTNVLPFRSSEQDAPSRPAISRCAKCHTEQVQPDAPYIPFHDTTRLAKLLRDPNSKLAEKILDRVSRTDDKRMPPPGNRELTSQQREAIHQFVGLMR